MLINFIHATSVLMAGSGMKELLAFTFESVDKMLSMNKYPQNCRGFRMLVEVLLGSLVNMDGVNSFGSLRRVLSKCVTESRTTKLCPDCLIRPVIIMMNFSHAGYEGDFFDRSHAYLLPCSWLPQVHTL